MMRERWSGVRDQEYKKKRKGSCKENVQVVLLLFGNNKLMELEHPKGPTQTAYGVLNEGFFLTEGNDVS